MNSGERMYGNPTVINNESGTAVELERVPLSQKTLDEAWLQELIRKHPGILPVEDVEPVYSPLIAIGREVGTTSGAIDNLFMSPGGYLTLVETKLWRNPQARREVVGQIIDYAKEVSQWTFEELNARVQEYNRVYEGYDGGLIQTIRNRVHEEEPLDSEARFIDTVCRNIKKGRFLLLIVGDGIRENVETMSEFLNQTPNMLYSLGLIELELYKLGESKFMVVPHTVVRTREVTRAVVRIEGETNKVDVDIDTMDEEKIKKGGRRKLSEDEFFEELKQNVDYKTIEFVRKVIEDMDELGCIIQMRSQSAMIRYPDPQGSRRRLTLFGITTSGEVFTGWIMDQLEKLGLNRELGTEFLSQTAALFQGIHLDSEYSTWSDNVSLAEFKKKYSSFLDKASGLIQELEI